MPFLCISLGDITNPVLGNRNNIIQFLTPSTKAEILLEYGSPLYGDCSTERSLTLSHIAWVCHTLLHKGQDGSICRKTKKTAKITSQLKVPTNEINRRLLGI